MYKGHSIWDQEQERHERYDNVAAGRDKANPGYGSNEAYSSESRQDDIYNTEKGEKEKEKEGSKGIEKELDQEKKYSSKDKLSEEDIRKKAASELHKEGIEAKKSKKNKKEHKSIEDAINKAMEEEKEMIYVDD
ncbi:hypothetical protein KY358_05660 [Candidatus Woesearchaeota archaeon]|nr:hypothetical protein [Candidatus Woesearchaeota archaeon]